MDWSNPEDRAALIERVGPVEYNRQHDKAREDSVVATVGGHKIRNIGTAFGRLWTVGATGKAFKTLDAAKAFARGNPA